jgi:hypothetical protein
VAARSFSYPDNAELVVLSPMRTEYAVVEHPPGRSHKLLKALAPASPFDHDAPIRCCPRHGSQDLRLASERAEAIPDWRLECVAELVATGPTLEVDQLLAVESTQHDPVDAATSARATAEWNRCDRRASRLELLPYPVAAYELAWRWS